MTDSTWKQNFNFCLFNKVNINKRCKEIINYERASMHISQKQYWKYLNFKVIQPKK